MKKIYILNFGDFDFREYDFGDFEGDPISPFNIEKVLKPYSILFSRNLSLLLTSFSTLSNCEQKTFLIFF